MMSLDQILSPPEVPAADRWRAALADQVARVLRETSSTDLLIRQVRVPVEGRVPALHWLRAQSFPYGLYWKGRRSATSIAAAGVADAVRTTGAPLQYDTLGALLDARLSDAPSAVRYYGGIRFDARQPPVDGRPEAYWRPFGTARMVLPRFEWQTTDAGHVLVCNIVLPRDKKRAEALQRSIQQLVFPASTAPGPLPTPVRRQDEPARDVWMQRVQDAVAAIRRGDLQKAVLARRVTLGFASALDPLLLLEHLANETPQCFHFGFRPEHGTAFVGATPERLFRLEDGVVESEAVAGTRARVDGASEDEALRTELMESEKDRREHAFVTDAIREQLAPFCRSIDVAPPTELRLRRKRHLCSTIRGPLNNGAHAVDFLRALHPTPAVGGVPTGEALDFIRTAEPFDRGWYAGPVGWMGPDAAEFAVAIRSGLVHGRQLALFSGAGLVEGSEPENEWAEIEQKISNFAAILGLGD
ncbi:isochorismate synthase [Salisaeta longa]|uniref:isochorismate synthase n=1 Tax=Salisaeta longa TaxID=503170 RepID=UPI00068660E1|nr:isochorismate synthase [Salisaeta longa]